MGLGLRGIRNTKRHSKSLGNPPLHDWEFSLPGRRMQGDVIAGFQATGTGVTEESLPHSLGIPFHGDGEFTLPGRRMQRRERSLREFKDFKLRGRALMEEIFPRSLGIPLPLRRGTLHGRRIWR